MIDYAKEIIKNVYVNIVANELKSKKKNVKEITVCNNGTYKAKPKQNRNDLCACGSGKKYKYCCMNKEK